MFILLREAFIYTGSQRGWLRAVRALCVPPAVCGRQVENQIIMSQSRQHFQLIKQCFRAQASWRNFPSLPLSFELYYRRLGKL